MTELYWGQLKLISMSHPVFQSGGWPGSKIFCFPSWSWTPKACFLQCHFSTPTHTSFADCAIFRDVAVLDKWIGYPLARRSLLESRQLELSDLAIRILMKGLLFQIINAVPSQCCRSLCLPVCLYLSWTSMNVLTMRQENLFLFCLFGHFQPPLQSSGYKVLVGTAHIVHLDCVNSSRGTAALPINFPLHPPPVPVQEKRIPDLLIPLFLLSWSLQIDITYVYELFWAHVSPVFCFFFPLQKDISVAFTSPHHKASQVFRTVYLFAFTAQSCIAHFPSKGSLFLCHAGNLRAAHSLESNILLWSQAWLR